MKTYSSRSQQIQANKNSRLRSRTKVRAKAIRIEEALLQIAPYMGAIFLAMLLALILSQNVNAERFEVVPFIPKYPLNKRELGCQFPSKAAASEDLQLARDCGQDRVGSIKLARTLLTHLWFHREGPATRLGVESGTLLTSREVSYLMYAMTWDEDRLTQALHSESEDELTPDEAVDAVRLRDLLGSRGIDQSNFLGYAIACKGNGTEEFPLEICPSERTLNSPEVINLASAHLHNQAVSIAERIARLNASPLGIKVPASCDRDPSSLSATQIGICLPANASKRAYITGIEQIIRGKYVDRRIRDGSFLGADGVGTDGVDAR